MPLSPFKQAPQAYFRKPKRVASSKWLTDLRYDIDIKWFSIEWRVRLAQAVFSAAVAMALFMTTLLTLISFVPLAIIFTLPGLFIGIIVLTLASPQLVYLYFAQDDVPTHAKRPFLVMTLRKCIQIDYYVLRNAIELACVGRLVLRDWFVRRVTRKHAFNWRTNILYGSGDLTLDVYWPSPDLTSSSLPVVVFLPPQIRPFSSRKLLFSSLGANLAQNMEVVVVIPNLTNYPEGRIKQQVIDARKVLNWVDIHIHRYGGDSRKLQLSGLGMGGLLAQLLPLQVAITKSRDQFLHNEKSVARSDLPNGVRDVKEYGYEISIPKIEGLMLFGPITNVDDQITEETVQGVQHLSTSRRLLGPGEKTCYFHSPAHLLYAARNVMKLDMFPSKVLFVHGGLDSYIKHTQSETMKEIFRGVGVRDTRVRVYSAGHWETILPLMCDMREPPIIDVVRDFLWEDNTSTPRPKPTILV